MAQRFFVGVGQSCEYVQGGSGDKEHRDWYCCSAALLVAVLMNG